MITVNSKITVEGKPNLLVEGIVDAGQMMQRQGAAKMVSLRGPRGAIYCCYVDFDGNAYGLFSLPRF